MTTDTRPMAPTDAELNELADACTPNTETGSLNYRKFASAVLAKWGAQPHCNQPPAFFTVFAKWNEDEVPLAQYSASSENGVLERVMDAAQREGYKGFARDRMTELGWRIGPVYAEPLPVVREPLTDEQLWANDEIMSLNADLGWHMETIRMFARAIERAHGIKGGQHGL